MPLKIIISPTFQSITALLFENTDILQFHSRNVFRSDSQSYQSRDHRRPGRFRELEVQK